MEGKITDASQMTKIHPNQSLSSPDGAVVDFKPSQHVTRGDIIIDNVSILYHSKELLKDTSLKILRGHKYGLVGANGCGKTTLLRHISNRQLPITDDIHILHVEQEAVASDQSALLFVLNADVKRTELLQEVEQLKIQSQLYQSNEKDYNDNDDDDVVHSHQHQANNIMIERIIEIDETLRDIHAYSAEIRASAILSGLQFTEAMKHKPTKEFSGGWRMRIALARALFLNPDFLILDEPTNHLDLNAVIWLESYLQQWNKTLLVVSHDRDFLNFFVTDIISLHEQKLIYYKGTYDDFENTRRLGQREESGPKIPPTPKKEKIYRVNFDFDQPRRILSPVIEIRDIGFAYDSSLGQDSWIFKRVNHRIDMDTRVAIVGPNGVGKSTLINLILGDIEPIEGEIVRHRKLTIAKFSQHFVDQLDFEDNAIGYIQKKNPEMKIQEIRTALGRFGLSGKTHVQSIQSLSGGQKSRLVFASIALTQPHIIFLDEPTNHLDMESVDALIQGLEAYQGGIVLISHDQRLITRVCNSMWVVAGDQRVVHYEGTFEQYRQELIDHMDDPIPNS